MLRLFLCAPDSGGLGFPHIFSLYPNNVIEVWYQMSITKKILCQLFKLHQTFKGLFMYWGHSYMNTYTARKGRWHHQTLFLLNILIISWSILCVLIIFPLPSSTLSRSPFFHHPTLCSLRKYFKTFKTNLYCPNILCTCLFPLELGWVTMGYILIEKISSLYSCSYQLPIVLWLAMRLHAQLQSACWDLVLFWLAQVLFILSQLLKVSM